MKTASHISSPGATACPSRVSTTNRAGHPPASMCAVVLETFRSVTVIVIGVPVVSTEELRVVLSASCS